MGAQAIGFAGTFFLAVSFHFDSTRKIFFFQLLGNLLYLVHFFCLHAYAGCISMIICMIYNLFLMSKNKFLRQSFWMVILIAVQVIFTWLTWENAWGLFPLAANTAFIISGWTGKPHMVRMANLAVYSPCWLIYDVAAFSIAGVVCEVISELSTVMAVSHGRSLKNKK